MSHAFGKENQHLIRLAHTLNKFDFGSWSSIDVTNAMWVMAALDRAVVDNDLQALEAAFGALDLIGYTAYRNLAENKAQSQLESSHTVEQAAT